MANDNKLAQLANDAVATHRERSRLFERLGDPRLTDDQRQETVDQYAEASAAFDKARSAVLNAAKKPAK